MNEAAERQTIEATLRAMNRCWTGKWNEPEFRQFIHKDAIAIAPTTPGRLEGQDAYVAGWREFAEVATIHSWNEMDYKIHLYLGGRSAVATYFFTITFTMGGITQTMKGRDLFFLIKEGEQWIVVADQFSPEPLSA